MILSSLKYIVHQSASICFIINLIASKAIKRVEMNKNVFHKMLVTLVKIRCKKLFDRSSVKCINLTQTVTRSALSHSSEKSCCVLSSRLHASSMSSFKKRSSFAFYFQFAWRHFARIDCDQWCVKFDIMILHRFCTISIDRLRKKNYRHISTHCIECCFRFSF